MRTFGTDRQTDRPSWLHRTRRPALREAGPTNPLLGERVFWPIFQFGHIYDWFVPVTFYRIEKARSVVGEISHVDRRVNMRFPYFGEISNAICEKSLKWKKLDTKSWSEAKNHPRPVK